jgi:transposase
VPCRAQVRELQRLLGKKTLESEILKEALEQASPKKRTLRSLSLPKDGLR